MALKLFRTTGYSTLLMPGEARLAPHPVRLVLWGTLWLAIACNVGLWRLVLQRTDDWRNTVASVLVIGGVAAIFLSLFGWRRTIKPALTIALIAGALAADGLWSQQLPIEALWQGPPRTWMPGWATFLRLQGLATLVVLGLVPIVAAWNAQLRRISGPAQLKTNVWGIVLGAVLLGAGLVLAH